MAVPCYVSTEWLGLGHATLRFRPKKVHVAESVSQAEDSQAPAQDGSFSRPGKTLRSWLPLSWGDGQHQIDTYEINCYLSTVYIGEYGEKKSEECGDTSQQQEVVGPSSLTPGHEDDLRPPGVAPEVWNAWLDYWQAWKEVLIPLSWVHKYRCHCTPEYVTWHDSYLEDYPEVLSLVTLELGSSQLEEDTVKPSPTLEASGCGEAGVDEQPDDTLCENSGVPAAAAAAAGKEGVDRKVLDDLFAKHSKQRYLVHLRSFLHESGVECGQDIDEFFLQEAGISFSIQTTADTHTTVMDDTQMLIPGCPEEPSQKKNCWNSEENCSLGKTKLAGNENVTPSCDKENKNKLEEELEDAGEATLQNATEPSIHEESHLNTSFASPEMNDRLSRSDPKDLGYEAEAVTGNSDDKEASMPEVQVSDPNASASSHHNKTAKKRRKKDSARVDGISWALKYVQKKTVSKAVSQDEEKAPQHLELSSVTHKSLELTPEGLEVAAGSSQQETQVTAKTDQGTSTTAPSTTREQDKSATTEEEEETGESFFFEWMDDSSKRASKLRDIESEKKALLQAYQRPSSCLAKLLTVCCATMTKTTLNFEKVLLPFAALHLLNLGFPGAAVVEYESGVTEEVPGERQRLAFRFDSLVFELKYKVERNLPWVRKSCLMILKDIVVPTGARLLTNLAVMAASGVDRETEYRFPASVFGVRWLPGADSSLFKEGKNVKRQQRRFHRWLEVQDPNLSPSCTVLLPGLLMHRVNPEPEVRRPRRVYQQVVREGGTEDGSPCLTLHTLPPCATSGVCGGSSVEAEVQQPAMEITFDKDGNFIVNKTSVTTEQKQEQQHQDSEDAEVEAWNRIIAGRQRLSYWKAGDSLPSDLPKDIHKYWAQRYRLFLKYDEGIRLDNESWYSVTPELLAAHQARRCQCDVVVDAMCGAGGNAIQLAKTCKKVIAIDQDPGKVELARHNAQVYGVVDRIEFRVGNFFKLAPYLKADVVYLSPPWGGMEYLEEAVYNVYRLGGTMNCARLLRAARGITPCVALYLPRNSDLCQVITLAGVGGSVDIEANYMGPKKKAITAYFGGLANKG